MKTTSHTCLCVAGRGTSCAVRTAPWSSPTCCRVLQGHRQSWETRSYCLTVAVLRNCLPHSARRRCTCILSTDVCTTPARRVEGALAWLDRLWPLSSAHSLFMLMMIDKLDNLHTFSGEGRSTDWPMSSEDTCPLWRMAAGGRKRWPNLQNWSKLYVFRWWDALQWHFHTGSETAANLP